MNKSIILSLFFIFPLILKAQITAADSLLMDLNTEETTASQSLLPDRMLFTQRMLWGENGLYRKVGIAPKVLTAETRAHELKIRRTMFRIHQGVGLATAAAMLAQGFVGNNLYKNGGRNTKDIHESIALGINIGYITTGLMSFTAPPPMINRKKFDNIKLHKILSVVHLSGMIATNVLADQAGDSIQMKKWHRAAGMTTFAAYAAAIATIKFEF
ncbi:hypothetical protein EGI22_20995 [Lacihabitans sp. LS3-19]|uniref:hypothetical protein n=1 Tax=Lacihabitans sp. LS3-19 TaxID=2487335 RepID=UPI0020CFBF1F|nr:hypothetical protein [Lacihabitans sp. LS3-19]MCP9770392.1 hypothetical protein [Lacihabitans sp. LS3-19]